MKPLTLEETAIKEEMKEKCLAKRQYVDENAKAKFDMLCHLEDFEVQYWELQQENQRYKEIIDRAKTELEQGITFCQNDSQGLYDKCNIAINREQRILNILKEAE